MQRFQIWGIEPVLQIILACIVFTRDINNQFIREGLEAMPGGTQWRAFARHAETMICDARSPEFP